MIEHYSFGGIPHRGSWSSCAQCQREESIERFITLVIVGIGLIYVVGRMALSAVWGV